MFRIVSKNLVFASSAYRENFLKILEGLWAMELHEQLTFLLDLAESLGITVRRVVSAGGSAEHPGGALVSVKGREMLFVDPHAPIVGQREAVASALRGRPELQEMFLRPEIRQLIEDLL